MQTKPTFSQKYPAFMTPATAADLLKQSQERSTQHLVERTLRDVRERAFDEFSRGVTK